jgi:deoxyribodipyrimidine photolyase-related protein
MGQSASDIMMTRLYFSSSNYILKMSNFKKDNWTIIWDAVYYNFIDKHKKLLSSNYATAMQVKHYTKKSIKDKEEIKKISHEYIKKLNK